MDYLQKANIKRKFNSLINSKNILNFAEIKELILRKFI